MSCKHKFLDCQFAIYQTTMILQFSENSKHPFIANTFHFQVSVFQLFNYTESFYKAAYNNFLLSVFPETCGAVVELTVGSLLPLKRYKRIFKWYHTSNNTGSEYEYIAMGIFL